MVRKNTYGSSRAAQIAAVRAALGPFGGTASPAHPPFTGEHSHVHSAYGHESADDDGQHSHPHSHSGDADHGSPAHDDAHALITPFGIVHPGDLPPGSSQPGARQHVRFEHGGMTVLNSAREAATDRAFRELAETAMRLVRP